MDRTWTRASVAFAILSVALIALSAVLLRALLQGGRSPRQVVTFRVAPLEDQRFATATGVDVALSPDGSRLVYVGVGGAGGTQLWQRLLNQVEAVPIPGTADPSNPVISPDGLSVAFVRGGALVTIALSGGAPFTVLAEGVSPNGLDWGPDGLLYFSDDDGAIRRVAPTGGLVETMTLPGPSVRHTAVDVLPGGRGLLVTVNSRDIGTTSFIGLADIEDGAIRELFPGNMGRYLAPGYVVFSTPAGQIMAVEFDLDRLEETSSAVPLIGGLAGVNPNFSEFALSETGSLVYRASPLGSPGDLVWVSREGMIEEIDPQWTGNLHFPSISPDGTKLAVDRIERGPCDLWIRDLERGSSVRLWTDLTRHRSEWTPDGRSLTFSASGEGSYELWTARADGTGGAERLLGGGRGVEEGFWSRDGAWLVYRTDNAEPGAGDILAIRPGVDSVPLPLAATEYTEQAPSLSPDSRFLAYTSNESGQFEVYVVPFPNPGDWRLPVSTGGGVEPVWGKTGRELFFRDSENRLVSVEVETTPEFSLGREQILFPAGQFRSDRQHAQYDVAPDDSRFLMIRNPEQGTYDLFFVHNFVEEVKERFRATR